MRDRQTSARVRGGARESVPGDIAVPRRVLRGTFSLIANRLAALGVWFFLTPFMVSHLGHTTYGLWALVGSIVAYASLLDLGIAESLVKFVAEHRAREEHEELKAMLASCLGMFLALGSAVILIGAILAPFIPRIFNVPIDQRGTASWAVFAAAASAGLSLPLSLPTAVLFGLQRLDLVAASTLSSTGLLAASTVAILSLHGGLVMLMLSGIPVGLFSAALSAYFVRRLAPDIRIRFRALDRRMIRRLASFSVPTFVLGASGQLETTTDDVIIGAVLPVTAVGPYSVARRLSTLPEVLSSELYWTLMPLASQFDAQDSRRSVSELVVTGTRTALAGFLTVGLGVIALGGRFLTAWIGPAFGSTGKIVIVLSCASLMYPLLGPGIAVSIGTDRHRVLAVLAIGGAVLNLALSIILIRPYGTLGVALGTLIATSLRAAVSIWYLARVHSVAPRKWLWSILVPAGVPALPAIATLLVLRETVDPTSVLMVLLVGVAGALVYAFGYLSMPSCTTERALIRHEITRLLRPWNAAA